MRNDGRTDVRPYTWSFCLKLVKRVIVFDSLIVNHFPPHRIDRSQSKSRRLSDRSLRTYMVQSSLYFLVKVCSIISHGSTRFLLCRVMEFRSLQFSSFCFLIRWHQASSEKQHFTIRSRRPFWQLPFLVKSIPPFLLAWLSPLSNRTSSRNPSVEHRNSTFTPYPRKRANLLDKDVVISAILCFAGLGCGLYDNNLQWVFGSSASCTLFSALGNNNRKSPKQDYLVDTTAHVGPRAVS